MPGAGDLDNVHVSLALTLLSYIFFCLLARAVNLYLFTHQLLFFLSHFFLFCFFVPKFPIVYSPSPFSVSVSLLHPSSPYHLFIQYLPPYVPLVYSSFWSSPFIFHPPLPPVLTPLPPLFYHLSSLSISHKMTLPAWSSSALISVLLFVLTPTLQKQSELRKGKVREGKGREGKVREGKGRASL